MVIARAEQGTLGALAVPRVTVGKNPFVKSQAGTYDSIIVIVLVFVHVAEIVFVCSRKCASIGLLAVGGQIE